jgi:serine/threonine protein phosphatase PrpC
MKTCPRCQIENEDDSRFCAECGAPLTAKAAEGCANCHAPAEKIDKDGFCSVCGCQRPVNADSRVSALSNSFAGASDKGKKHFQNEDVFEIGACNGFYIAVICDGVSTSAHPAEASRLAAEAAKDHLGEKLTHCNGNALTKVIEDSIEAAEKAVQTLPKNDERLDPPASTIVVAVADKSKVTIGWLGDSRAYFIGDKKSRQITRDHSWVNEQVDEGKLSYEAASRSRMSHTITKTLGGYHDTDNPDQPSFAELEITESGWLLLCTDGLWNYTENIREVIPKAGNKPTAQELASFLVDWANQQGGKDNITVIALKVNPETKPLGSPSK